MIAWYEFQQHMIDFSFENLLQQKYIWIWNNFLPLTMVNLYINTIYSWISSIPEKNKK